MNTSRVFSQRGFYGLDVTGEVAQACEDVGEIKEFVCLYSDSRNGICEGI